MKRKIKKKKNRKNKQQETIIATTHATIQSIQKNETITNTHPKNFNDDPNPAKLDVMELAGIVSDRCKLLFKCVESSNVALRCPLNRIGWSVYIVLLLLIATFSICGVCCTSITSSSSFRAPNGSFWVTGVLGEILQ